MAANKLQELRRRSGLSQGELARQMGVDASLLSRWESGDREPSFDQELMLARLLGVTLDYLQHGSLQVEFKFRAHASLSAEEQRAINRALNDITQQLYFLDTAWRIANRPPKPFLLNVDLTAQQLTEAADQIRDLLRLNRRVTFGELKEALTERNVHVFAWYLPAQLSGVSYRGNFAAIFINENHPPGRRLFTLAHETAHLLCHLRACPPGNEESPARVSISSNRTPEEKEADRLAAELLMPEVVVRKIAQEHGDALRHKVVLDSVARFFNVSREALFYRLVELKLIFGWEDKKDYFSKFMPDELDSPVRVIDIARQVAPEFLKVALALYGAEEIPSGKLKEWFACSRHKVEEYLNQSEQLVKESGLLQ